MAMILSRRAVLAGTGATLFCLKMPLASDEHSGAARLTLYVAFDSAGNLVVTTGKSEMGQGVLTGFAQIIADEIGADWTRVRAQTGPVDPALRPEGIGEQITGGSMSIRLHYDALRRAGAAAREMLIAEAAERWQVDPSGVTIRNHAAEQRSTGHRIDLRDLAAGAALRQVPQSPPLRPSEERSLVGRSLPSLDLGGKLDGSRRYGIDLRMPGMVFAAIRHAPVAGSRTQHINAKPITSRPGIVGVVDLGSAVAVVAERWWLAQTAVEQLDVTFSNVANVAVTSASLERTLMKALDRDDLPVAVTHGPIDQPPLADHLRLMADYTAPLLAHATMEPMSCTAIVSGDRCEVFAPTQGQDAARRAAAQASGLPETAVTIHTVPMGGGFGRRYEWDFVSQAVTIAKQIGRPVNLLWSREQDIRHDFFRPPAAARLVADVGPNGRIARLDAKVAAPSANLHAWPAAVVNGIDMGALEGLVDNPYEIPAFQVRYGMTPIHLNVGFWRSVACSINIPILEGFMDELAEAAGTDPVEFRLRHLSHDDRLRSVLTRCAEMIRNAQGSGAIGFAVGRPMKTPSAVAIEAVRDHRGIHVRQAVAVVDCGTVINPQLVQAQAEGGLLFGIPAAMKQEITIDDGVVVQSNLHDFPLMTLAEAPSVSVHIMTSDEPPTGIGEPTTALAMAALLNAVSRLRGNRLRALPVTRADR